MEKHIVQKGVYLCGVKADAASRYLGFTGISIGTYRWVKRLHVPFFTKPHDVCVEIFNEWGGHRPAIEMVAMNEGLHHYDVGQKTRV